MLKVKGARYEWATSSKGGRLVGSSFVFIIIIFIIGFIGSFISGMLGVGGSIINYPMLLYIPAALGRSEEHTSELQSRGHIVCRLLLEKTNSLLFSTFNT